MGVDGRYRAQVVLFVSGFFVHAALSVAGVVFGLTWWYVLHVRRTVLATAGMTPSEAQ